ncbi:hypothetical protein [Microlunatus antarcticus]
MAGKLSTSGFVRRAHGLFTITLNEDATGLLALSTTTYRSGERVFVTPNVGVVHREIAQVMSALAPESTPQRYNQATLSTSLTALVPGASSRDWIFEKGSDFEPRTRALDTLVRDYALPFMHRYEDLSQIIVGLRQKLGGPPSDSQSLFYFTATTSCTERARRLRRFDRRPHGSSCQRLPRLQPSLPALHSGPGDGSRMTVGLRAPHDGRLAELDRCRRGQGRTVRCSEREELAPHLDNSRLRHVLNRLGAGPRR